MPTCKKCGEEIQFIQLASGKHMPVDSDSLQTWGLDEGVVVVTPEGKVLRGGGGSGKTFAKGFMSHFATCPFADDFRKGKAGL